jgi:hypothetical protein
MNLIEIGDNFPTELAVVEYFEKFRWPVIKRCLYCKEKSS